MENMMLEIRITDNRKRRRLVLEGTLTGHWVEELKAKWTVAHAGLQKRKLVVDLTRPAEKTSLANWRMFFCRVSTTNRCDVPVPDEMIQCNGTHN